MNIFKKTATFLREVRAELTKVSWSSRSELIGSTVVVITITSIITIFIAVVDLILSKILSLVFK